MNSEFNLPESFRFTARSKGRTITEGDFSAMTNLTWTTSEIHTNRDVADERHGGRLLAGACVLAFALGLATPAILPGVESRGIRLIALLGYDSVRFVSPLYPGDTVYINATLRMIEKTSTTGRGIIHFQDRLVDSKDRVIAEYTRKALCDVSESSIAE